MPTDHLFSGYAAYTDIEELAATAEVSPDEPATTPSLTVTSSIPCLDFTGTVTVAITC